MAYSQNTFPDGNVSANMFDPNKPAPSQPAQTDKAPINDNQPEFPQTPPTPPVTAGTPPAQQPPASQMPAGMDPRLAALYQQNGMTPGGSGTGFADWQYWQDKANGSGDWNYFLDRLGKDMNGTGTDQPTGTPGQGAWSNSGASQGAGASMGGAAGSSFTQSTPFDQLNPDWAHYQQSPQDSQLYGLLMGQANQSLNIDPNDPIIKHQVDAFRAEQDRGTKNYLAGAAERGGPNNNMDAAARSANEKAGQATSSMQAQLMQNELTARRQQIQQALQESGSLLSQQDQIALQRELGLINSSIQKWGMGNQNQQYYAGLNLGQQQLNSQNDQFASNFGLNAANQANYWDSIRSGLK